MGYRYIGSKVRVVDTIIDYLNRSVGRGGRFIDAFSGTGIVASCAADTGWPVLVNDMMYNACIMSEVRLICKDEVPFISHGGYEHTIAELNALDGMEGYFFNEYSPASGRNGEVERRYFTEENARRIDAILQRIMTWEEDGTISQKEKTVLIASLLFATNDVANIAGTYGCFLSKWSPQSQQALSLAPVNLRDNPVDYQVANQDVFSLKSQPEDVVYFDPPYTKRQYASYYHILETIAVGDKPIVTGVSGLRPWKDKASVFCYKSKALQALCDLIVSQPARCVLLSYSDEGHIKLEELTERLSQSGEVLVNELRVIGRYRPNVKASSKKSTVREFLIDFRHR
jgi:adenine-specific DNA-methyltransferase